jgi:Mycotoxin biosynthesis protein UstYa
MCNADVGVVTYNWINGFTVPYPDFNMYKKCRKVDKIIDWVARNTLHLHKDHIDLLGNVVPLAIPPGATQLPSWERSQKGV